MRTITGHVRCRLTAYQFDRSVNAVSLRVVSPYGMTNMGLGVVGVTTYHVHAVPVSM